MPMGTFARQSRLRAKKLHLSVLGDNLYLCVEQQDNAQGHFWGMIFEVYGLGKCPKRATFGTDFASKQTTLASNTKIKRHTKS